MLVIFVLFALCVELSAPGWCFTALVMASGFKLGKFIIEGFELLVKYIKSQEIDTK